MASPVASPPSQHERPPIFQRCDRTAKAPYSRNEYLARTLWRVVQATLFRFSPNPAKAWRVALLRMFGAKIGNRVNIRNTAKVFHPWLLKMGDWSMLSDEVVVYNLGPIEIGEHSVISQGTWLCAGTHDYTQPHLPLLRPSIHIGRGVWIAMQAFIGPGVEIGDNTVIGARAMVAKSVPAGVVAAGNPCRVIKPRPMENTSTDPRDA